MYNYSLEFGEFFEKAGILILFLLLVFGLIFIILWFFSGFGIQEFAKKKKIDNSWLAYIPVGRNYIIAKLGFEKYVPTDKKNPTLTWVTLGISAASLLIADENVYYLLNIALTVFQTIAFYNIYKSVSKRSTVMTVFTALFGSLIGGIFLYAIKNNKEIVSYKEEIKAEDTTIEDKQEKNNEENKKETTRPNFCPNCGNKITKTTKFCSNCGRKID